MKRWVVAVVLAALSVIGMPAVAAHADQSDCAEGFYGTTPQNGYEFFEVDNRFVPPPMRSQPWDCAVRVASREFDETLAADGGYVTSIQYFLLYVDMSYEELIEYYRAWERSGFADGTQINVISADGGGTESVALGAEDLATRDPRPSYVHARFSNGQSVPAPSTPGSNIYELTWTDGVVAQSASGIEDRPQLFASVLLTEPVSGGTGLADPSRMSDLRTIQEAAPTGTQWAIIGTGSLMLMLVVGWPSTLLNSVVGSRYQAMVRWVTSRFQRKKADAADPPGDPTIKRSGLPGWLMWPGFALAAILGAFVDPDFGLNLMSLRLVVTLFLSFLLFNLTAWAIVRRVAVRLQPESDPYLRFRWGSLILVFAAVLVARLLGLDPGVIFGLVAGVAYATTLQAAKSAIVTIVGSAFGLALALVAWVGYSLLAPAQIDNFAYVFLVEFLAGVTVKGVSTLPLSLLPLGTLDGAKLFGWKKAVWGASYVVGLAAFMVVLATIPKAWGEIPDFLRWIWIFGAYAVVAIVIWAVNARMLKKKPLPPEQQQGDQPDAITID
ncbi:hypothetical protein [Pseudolysinimonas yzui]|uniref:Uncharacterized protein n=1 Tax=Pseudolysinimonas yzui TaxID=2708254 RepID=A0A8J3GN65_9MICO|nr:hypothetical protein [Pseudolysinimonas yzui]GHF05973.1 hypothetical protein GCM10011600_03190 [Pseudolysinimonas yzui]